MEDFERTLVIKFPEIVSYHDLHIWQLSAHKSVATVHIMFENPRLYTKIIDDVRAYFQNRGITEVTIQPEFQSPKSPSIECLMQCNASDCVDKVCCKDSRTDLREIISTSPNGDAETPVEKHSTGENEDKSFNTIPLKSVDVKKAKESVPDEEISREKIATIANDDSIKEIVVAKCDKLEVKSPEESISTVEKSEICLAAKVLDEINVTNDSS